MGVDATKNRSTVICIVRESNPSAYKIKEIEHLCGIKLYTLQRSS